MTASIMGFNAGRRGCVRFVDVRVAVVGHVEWVEFVRVEEMPRAGEIVTATATWQEAAGGGAVVAAELARLAGEVTLFTALGDDDLGTRVREQLERLGVRVHAARAAERQRRAVCHVDAGGERTITVIGEKLRPRGADGSLPWHELEDVDVAVFVSGDVDALHRARRARLLVAVSRELPTLREGALELDALVGSGADTSERYRPGDLEPPPRLVVTTAGKLGGWAQPGGPFRAAPLPGPIEDAYGCGDCFTAGLAFGLAEGGSVEESLALGARRGALALTRRGAHGRQRPP